MSTELLPMRHESRRPRRLTSWNWPCGLYLLVWGCVVAAVIFTVVRGWVGR